MKSQKSSAELAAEKFFSLADCAARNGGFWVSPGGGTLNAAAGVLSRKSSIGFNEARHLVDQVGTRLKGSDWYQGWAYAQPFRWDDEESSQSYWDIKTVMAAACGHQKKIDALK